MNQEDAKILKEFSIKMRNKRQELKLSQMELAELAKCHINSISRIEARRADPSLTMIVKIARALQISAKDLIPD